MLSSHAASDVRCCQRRRRRRRSPVTCSDYRDRVSEFQRMTDKRSTKPIVGQVGTDSLNAALDLLRERSARTGKRKREDTEDKSIKIASHCTNHQRFGPIDREKTNAALGFSENHALTEMRSCLARHDWSGLRQLFPLILGCYSELEPVIWRYVFTILLCTPERDSSHLREFLELCVGPQSLEDNNMLELLLALKNKDDT